MSAVAEYVGIRDAAEELGLKPVRMRQFCEANHIGGKLGRTWIISRETLESLKREPIRFDRPFHATESNAID